MGSAGEALRARAQAGLEGVARDMYISAEQLGENVDGAYRRHEAQDFAVLPLDFAAQHVVPVRFCQGVPWVCPPA